MEINTMPSSIYADHSKGATVDKPAITKEYTSSATDKMKSSQNEAEVRTEVKAKLSQKEMESLIKDLNNEIGMLSTDLRFGFNNQAEMLEISVINTKTDKVIRRFPTEEAVKLMKTMKDFIGLLFDTRG